MSETIIDRRREEFPSLANGIYLLSHSLGPMPRSARESMLTYLERWTEHVGEDAWAASWWELSHEVGDRIAGLIGGAPGSVQVQPSASAAMSAVASCFEFGAVERRRVITTALDFPSMGYIWEEQRRIGADVLVVPSDDDITVSTERILNAIDERTALVAMSHVSYRSSARVDASAIVEHAHGVGAAVLLDIYQSAGVVEIDAAGWNVDFLIGGSIKWLCGGPACGYLYVRPDLIERFEPRLTGWIAHADPFAFSHDPMRYDDTVRRFAQGTPNIPGLYSFLPGLKIVEQVGISPIAAESRRRTQWMIEFALRHGWRLHSPVEAERRGGSVMIQFDNAPALVTQLARENIFVDRRPSVGLRLSPYFFNTDDEIEQAMNTLAALAASG